MKPTLRPTIFGTSIPTAIRHLAWLAPIVCACNASALTWNVGGPSDNWTNGGDANWLNGATPTSWTNGNFQAVFGGADGEAITVSTVTANNITFNNTGPTAYTLSGGTITLSNTGGGDPFINAQANATINSNIVTATTQSWGVATGKTLTLGGTITSSTAGAAFGFRGLGSYLVNGSIGSSIGPIHIGDAAAGGTTAVTFTQANSFTGFLRVGDVANRAATLNFSNVNQLGSGTGANYISIQQGSTLNFTGTGNQSQTNRQFFWNQGAATIGVTDANANLTIGSSAGGLRDQNFTKTGAGTLTLNSTATVTGGTLTVNGGTLVVQATNTSTGATTISGSGSTLTLGTGGTLSNTTAITIGSGATLNLSGSANNQMAGGTTNGTLAINGTLNATTNQAHTLGFNTAYFSTISMNNGTLANTFGQNTSGFGAFYIGSSRTITATGTNTISGLGVIGITTGTVLTLSPTGTGDIIDVTGTLGQGANGTAGGITKAGLGTVTLSGANVYTGATTVSAGTLQIGNGGTTGSLSTSSQITNNATLAFNRSNTLTQGTDFDSAFGGTGAVIQAGSGNTILSGNNTYTGGTTITGGTLTLGHATDTLSNTGAVTVDGGAAALSIGVNSDAVGAVSLKNGGSITGTGGTLTGTSYAFESGSVSAKLGGGGGLNKTTGGTVTLTGANTYTGNTAVTNGTLRVNGSTDASSAVSVANGATLGGTGSIGGSVNVTGVLAPGASIESLATGSVTLNNLATLAVEIQDTGVAGADLLAITGNLNIDTATGNVTLDLSKIGSAVWTDGNKITLASYTGSWNGGLLTYDNSDVTDGSQILFDGTMWTFNYDDTSEGNNFASESTGNYMTMTAVPEPAAALLGGLGLLTLLRRRRA